MLESMLQSIFALFILFLVTMQNSVILSDSQLQQFIAKGFLKLNAKVAADISR